MDKVVEITKEHKSQKTESYVKELCKFGLFLEKKEDYDPNVYSKIESINSNSKVVVEVFDDTVYLALVIRDRPVFSTEKSLEEISPDKIAARYKKIKDSAAAVAKIINSLEI